MKRLASNGKAVRLFRINDDNEARFWDRLKNLAFSSSGQFIPHFLMERYVTITVFRKFPHFKES